MLKLAYPYKDKLQTAYYKIILNDKYKYYNFDTFWNYEINIEDSNWNRLQLVSVDKNDNVIGFFSAKIDRTANNISNVAVLNFYDKNITFSKDFYQFLKDLFLKYHFNKISFNVIIGNPAEKMYDKLISKYGGRIVGIQEKETKLPDGRYYDVKLYEVLRDDFIKH